MARRSQPQPSDEALVELLRQAAAGERMPDRNLAPGALRRLQRRQTAISNVNEFFDAIFAIMRGLGSLLAADESQRRNTLREKDEERHG